MKQAIQLSAIIVATFCILLATIIPHHHHDEVSCVVSSSCTHNNLNHQGDCHEGSACTKNVFCISNSHFVNRLPSQDNLEEYFTVNFSQILHLYSSLFDDIWNTTDHTTPLPLYTITYQSITILSSNGLRAPPFA